MFFFTQLQHKLGITQREMTKMFDITEAAVWKKKRTNSKERLCPRGFFEIKRLYGNKISFDDIFSNNELYIELYGNNVNEDKIKVNKNITKFNFI